MINLETNLAELTVSWPIINYFLIKYEMTFITIWKFSHNREIVLPNGLLMLIEILCWFIW